MIGFLFAACLLCAATLASCAGGNASDGAQVSATPFDEERHVTADLASPTPSTVDCIGRLPAARLILAKEGYKRGAEEIEKVIEMGCDTAYARYELGKALNGDGQHKRAAEQFRISIRMEPKEWAPHNALTSTLIINLGEFDEGLRELEVARKIDDLDDLGYTYEYYVGRALEGKGQLNEALTHYRRFLKGKSAGNTRDEQYRDTQKRIQRIEKLTSP